MVTCSKPVTVINPQRVALAQDSCDIPLRHGLNGRPWSRFDPAVTDYAFGLPVWRSS